MITIEDIINFSKPHPNGLLGARQTILFNERYKLSIVGGAIGLYGDFKEDFEVAIMTPDSTAFITKFFSDDNDDDVIAYLSADKTQDLVNKLFPKDFQVK